MMTSINSNNNMNTTTAASAGAKTLTKPKRPLSAYNLFYRFKRLKILEAHASGNDTEEFITKLMATPSGLEGDGIHNVSSPLSSSEYLKELRRNTIRETLVDNLNPNTSPRIHKAGNSKLNFLEMSKLMVTSWKGIDEFALSGEWLIFIVYMLFLFVKFIYCFGSIILCMILMHILCIIYSQISSLYPMQYLKN